jgi:hypothetical protein
MTDQTQPDLMRLPSGEREWSEFIQQAAGAGDLIERHFIELKLEAAPVPDLARRDWLPVFVPAG